MAQRFGQALVKRIGRSRLVLAALCVLLGFNTLACRFGMPIVDQNKARPTDGAVAEKPSGPTSAEKTLSGYLDALRAREFGTAADHISKWSLASAGVEREEWILYFEKLVFEQDWELLEYRVNEQTQKLRAIQATVPDA